MGGNDLPQFIMIGGTEIGLLRSIKYPLQNLTSSDYIGHEGEVTNMHITHNDFYLFTSGKDGCMIIFELKDQEGRKKRERHDKTPLSQEVLVTKNDLQEIKQKHFELNEHKEEAIVQSDFMKRLNEIKTQEKLKEKADDFARDNQIWEAACEEVRLEIEDSHTFYDGEQKK